MFPRESSLDISVVFKKIIVNITWIEIEVIPGGFGTVLQIVVVYYDLNFTLMPRVSSSVCVFLLNSNL